MITTAQVAQMLGVSRRTASNYAQRLAVPSVAIGGSRAYLWREADLQAARALIASGTVYGARPHTKNAKRSS